MTIFDKQDAFTERMLSDYSKDLIPQAETFRPYFDWKSGKDIKSQFPIQVARKMQEVTSKLLDGYYEKHQDAPQSFDAFINDDPWQNYRWLGDDAYVVSYLEAIEADLTNIMLLM